MKYLDSLKVGKKLAIGYITVVVAVVIVAVVILISLGRLTGKFSFVVEHDLPVLENGIELEKLMVDLETGERGFLITGKEEFLEPYYEGLKKFDSLIETEKKLVSDNPPQVKKLEEIQQLKSEWLSMVAEPEIALRYKANKANVSADKLQETLKVGVGKGIMDTMRGIMDGMVERWHSAGNINGVVLTDSLAKAMVDRGDRRARVSDHRCGGIFGAIQRRPKGVREIPRRVAIARIQRRRHATNENRYRSIRDAGKPMGSQGRRA